MFLLFKILFWIWILEIKLSQLNFKIAKSNVRGKNNFAYCFKCSKINRNFKSNGLQEFINSYRCRTYTLSSVSDPVETVKFGNVNSQYLSNLNWELINLNNSLVNNTYDQSYRDLERIFDMISEPVASLFSEPFEVDYKSKLEELNTKFGLNLDRIDPPFILKLSTYGKSKGLDLSFEYLTEQKTDNGKIENKLWKRELKKDVPKDLKKQFNKAMNEFSKTIGNFFIRFYKDETANGDLLHRATTLGLQATGELFDALSLLQLKNNPIPENLKKSLDLIVHYSHLDSLRTRSYNKLIEHFFKNNDPDSILEVLKHYKNYSDKKITSTYLTQYLLALANKYEEDLDKLRESHCSPDFFDNKLQYVIYPFDSEVIGDKNQFKSKEDENKFRLRNKELLLELKEKLKEGLELYKECHLSPFNFTSELAEIVLEKFNEIIPGLFKISYVRGNEYISGTCGLCKSEIKYDDLSENERYEIFSKMLKTISITCPNELEGLFKYYEFLKRSKICGNQYTCIIDGQNIGYNRNTTNVLNWLKLNYSYNFMKSIGENPIIVLPQKGVNHLLKNIKHNDQNSFKTINHMIQNGSIYLIDKNSYDDNYLLLAGMVTFTDKELELFKWHLKERNIKLPQLDWFNNGMNYNRYNNTNGINMYNSNNNINENNNKKINQNDNNNNINKNNRNVVILTNDRLSNLRIENLDKELLDRWMCYSLINFNSFGSEGREIFVLGQRLKYTFDIISDNDRYHIPIGMDRVFTNSFEIHKCSFKIKKFEDNTSKIILNLCQDEETPIKTWIRKNSKYLYPSYDKRHNECNDMKNEKKNIENKSKKDDKNNTKESDVFHRSPEIARMMFSPSWRSEWLCINLKAFDKEIKKL